MDLYLWVSFLLTLPTVHLNDCETCNCEPTLNLVHCFGYEVTQWPQISNNDWIYEISFIKTRISSLPILENGDFINLNTVVIEQCPLLLCSDINVFQKLHPNVMLITDVTCFYTSTDKMTSEISESTLNVTLMQSTIDMQSTSSIPTVIATSDPILKYVVSAIIGIVLMLLTLLTGLIICYFKQKSSVNTHEYMIELSDFS